MTRIAAIAAAMAIAAFTPLGVSQARAQTVEAGDLMIIHPTARPNLPNRPTAAYVAIANDGAAADRLIAIGSPAFDSAEIHVSSMVGGVMTMKPVEAIDLPAGDTVELATGGYHIMLFGAKQLFRPGDTFPLVLTFEKAGEIAIEVMVEKIDPSGAGGMKTDHGTMHHGTTGKTGQTGG